MRALTLISIFGPLASLASNVLGRDIDSDPVTSTTDSFGGIINLYDQWPQLGSVPVNRTEGSTRSGKRQFTNPLEIRQNDVCTDPGFVLVCPITENLPCCDPKFPVCCHDPSDTCCPTGTFCAGLKTCCQTGTVACGEGCCPSGTTCCDSACCSAGYTCVSSGVCRDLTATSTSVQGALTSTFQQTGATNKPTATTANGPTPTESEGNLSNTNHKKNNTAVIGGVVGGVLGGLLLIGGGIAAWFFYNKSKVGSSNAATTQPQGYGWATGGTPGLQPIGQPQMTSTSTPFTPPAASGPGAGFSAQQAYGAPGSPYQQPSTPSNTTDYGQPPVSQYSYGEYGAAAPPTSVPGSAPWSGGQAYGPPGGFVPSATPGPAPGYHPGPGTPLSSNPDRSVYGGMAADPMQPGPGAFDLSTSYGQTQAATGPQVQTWVERPGGR